MCLSARSVELCCSVYNIADTSVAQNRFFKTPRLCFWLPCRRRQQHKRDEGSRAVLLPPAKPRAVLVAVCPGEGAGQTAEWHTLYSAQAAERCRAAAQGVPCRVRSGQGSGLDLHQVDKTIPKSSWPELQTRAGLRAGSEFPQYCGDRDVGHPSDHSLAFPKSLPEQNPPLCCMQMGKALDRNCQCDTKDVLFTLFFPVFSLCLPQSESPAFLPMTLHLSNLSHLAFIHTRCKS